MLYNAWIAIRYNIQTYAYTHARIVSNMNRNPHANEVSNNSKMKSFVIKISIFSVSSSFYCCCCCCGCTLCDGCCGNDYRDSFKHISFFLHVYVLRSTCISCVLMRMLSFSMVLGLEKKIEWKNIQFFFCLRCALIRSLVYCTCTYTL